MTIHFICRGNVLRSLIAETYLNSLQLNNITVTSSGTVTDQFKDSDKPFFASTLQLLKHHGIESFAKAEPQQLTQQRVDNQDLTICMNQIVVDEAVKIVTLPGNTRNWNICDIGEGTRIIQDGDRHNYEEEIYQEITNKVDQLVSEFNLN